MAALSRRRSDKVTEYGFYAGRNTGMLKAAEASISGIGLLSPGAQ